MAQFLFVDESGHDRGESPYEVLAGVSVRDADLWNLIVALRDAEVRCFGGRYTAGDGELKAKKLLKRKTFRLAAQLPPIPPADRALLARECLERGDAVGKAQLTALAQAKLAYVAEVLDICFRYRCRVFASIVPQNAPQPVARHHLRKDYSYLFERFFYFLEDVDPDAIGVVVFDELDRSRSHILIDQMDRYFLGTVTGRRRSSRILPEPLFVHSELTTGVQLADLIAYIVSWGFRTPSLRAPAREELIPLAARVAALRYRALREKMGRIDFSIWSFAIIDDLRTREELLLAAGSRQ